MSLPRPSPPDADADGGEPGGDEESPPGDALAERTEEASANPPSRRRRRLVAVLGRAAFPIAGTLVPLPYRVTDDCQLEAARRAHLRFAVAGRVQEVLVKEGDQVQQGQLVARLCADELQNELERARSRVKKVDAELGQL